jgi:hypothetical protein
MEVSQREERRRRGGEGRGRRREGEEEKRRRRLLKKKDYKKCVQQEKAFIFKQVQVDEFVKSNGSKKWIMEFSYKYNKLWKD